MGILGLEIVITDALPRDRTRLIDLLRDARRRRRRRNLLTWALINLSGWGLYLALEGSKWIAG